MRRELPLPGKATALTTATPCVSTVSSRDAGCSNPSHPAGVMLGAVVSHPGRLSADFEFGQSYALVFDKTRDIYFIDGADGRSVASVPVGVGGKVTTRANTWLIKPERHGRSWAIIARTREKEVVGGIREALIPYTFKLRIGGDSRYQVTNNPIHAHWTIRHGHSHMARISGIQTFALARRPMQPKDVPDRRMVSPFTLPTSSPGPRGIPTGEITILERSAEPREVALAILLTLEMIKAEATMPVITANDGPAYGQPQL